MCKAGLGGRCFTRLGSRGGQIVGCGDTGVDVRHCAPQQPASLRRRHIERRDHTMGTDHVAGSIAGRSPTTTASVRTTAWPKTPGWRSRTSARSPRRVFQKFGKRSHIAIRWAKTTTNTRVAGARIHSDSWGWSSKYYGQKCTRLTSLRGEIPRFCRCLRSETTVGNAQGIQHGDGRVVYYADGRHLRAPANAKNILGVGATLSSNSGSVSSVTSRTPTRGRG